MIGKAKKRANNQPALMVFIVWTDHQPGSIAKPLQSRVEFLNWLKKQPEAARETSSLDCNVEMFLNLEPLSSRPMQKIYR